MKDFLEEFLEKIPEDPLENILKEVMVIKSKSRRDPPQASQFFDSNGCSWINFNSLQHVWCTFWEQPIRRLS